MAQLVQPSDKNNYNRHHSLVIFIIVKPLIELTCKFLELLYYSYSLLFADFLFLLYINGFKESF